MFRTVELVEPSDIRVKAENLGGYKWPPSQRFSGVNFPSPKPKAGVFKTVCIFCGAGLFVSLLFATYGLDLSAGFF